MKTLLSAVPRFLGSFGLAVALLLILLLLTWFGTLDQVHNGLYDVQKRYFESLYVKQHIGPVPIVLPGGMVVMGLFALNLLFGGMIRIRWNKRNAGVLIAHFGMAFLMIAGAVKQLSSEDGLMKLRPKQVNGVFESSVRYEVVIWDATDDVRMGGSVRSPVTEYRIDPDDVRAASGSHQRKFTSQVLPFELVLERYLANSRVVPAAGIGVPQNPVIDGWTAQYVKPPKVDSVSIPAVYATVLTPDGGRKQGILWGMERVPWTFELGDRTWAVTLRRELYDLPFALRLDEFRKEFHPGVGMARAFESDITRLKREEPDRQVLVEMNRPLREDGYVVYQAQYGTDPDGVDYTVLQIVRNPSDQWPKYACYVIGVGLLLAFGQRLLNYLGQERRRREREATA
ncbi:MAG: cytochrome c biogenesis protein ResB [Planctomycetota bacterium]